MKKIGIIVAMDKEYEQLSKVFEGRTDIVLQKCGIGKVNAAVGATEMLRDHQPDLIVSSGCAGGASTSLEVMDVVAASSCAYHDVYCGDNAAYGQVLGMPARFEAPQALIDKALQIPRVKAGLTVSGDWFVDSKEKMREILDHFPEAMAVDMESCAIAQVCHRYAVPFISFRVISDIPLKDTKASQYFDFWDRVAEDSFEVTLRFVESILCSDAQGKKTDPHRPLQAKEKQGINREKEQWKRYPVSRLTTIVCFAASTSPARTRWAAMSSRRLTFA